MAPKKKTPRTEADTPAEAEAPVKKISRTESGASSGRGKVTEEEVLAGTTPFVRASKDSDFDAGSMLKIISWNVAGLRGVVNKGNELQKLFDTEKPDILCLQESKLSDWKDCPSLAQIKGYEFVDSICVVKKGYAGTRTYFRVEEAEGGESGKKDQVRHICGFNLAKPSEHDPEGRVITTSLLKHKISVVNTYVPNAGMTLDRLDYRVKEYDPMVRHYLLKLQEADPSAGIIWTGDLNVAERDYDRFFASDFKAMQKVPGFTPEERASFRTTLAETKMVDAFRHLYPNASKAYTFYSARFQARQKGNGWRLDYFVVSAALTKRIVDCYMLPEYTTSDHVPLVLWLKKK